MNTVALALLACALPAHWQDPSIGSPAEDPVLVRLADGQTIRRTEYLEHLFTTFGSARLEELVLDRLLAVEVEKLDQEKIGATTRAALADPDGRARSVLEQRIQHEFRGDATAFRASLQRTGLSMTEVFAATRQATEREDRLTACVQAGREADEAALQRLFDHHFGVDGWRVTVRHLFLSFGTVRHEIQDRRPGSRVTGTEVERVTRERSVGLLKMLDEGAQFESLVQRSDDRRRPDGTIPDYNFLEYGPEFAAAVRLLIGADREPAAGDGTRAEPRWPSAVHGPLRTSHGYHLLQVMEGSHTRQADVHDTLLRLLREAPPTLAERNRVRDSLLIRGGFKSAERR